MKLIFLFLSLTSFLTLFLSAHEGDHSHLSSETVTHHEEQELSLPTNLPKKLVVKVERRGETRTLVLRKHSIRGENFQLLIQDSSGELIPTDPGPVNTYMGGIQEDPEAIIGAVMTDAGIMAQVLSDSEGRWSIVPIDENAKTRSSGTGIKHAIVEETVEPLDGNHLHPESELGTSTKDNSSPASGIIPRALAPTGITNSTVKRAEIGFDITSSAYANRYGSSQDDVMNNLNHFVTSTLNTIYVRDCLIEHVLGQVIIRTDAATDPYTEHNGITGDLLNEFRFIWNNNLGATTHDLAHLHHGRGGGGLAYVGTVCGSFAYSCADGGDKHSWRGFARHEVTHSWALGHNPGRREVSSTNVQFGVMWGGPHDRFTSDESVAVINHRNSRGCLTDIGEYTAANIRPYGSWDRFDASYGTPILLDVLANDHDANNSEVQLINIFAVTGQTIIGTTAISSGTGPGGRDQILYTPPANGPSAHVEQLYYIMLDDTGLTGGGRLDVTVKQPFVPKPLNRDIILADSATDWNPSFQGSNGWQYGFFSNANNTNFTLFTGQGQQELGDIGEDTSIWLNGTNNPRIGQFTTYPSATSVWRWTSSYQGDIQLSYDARRLQTGGDGQTFLIYKNGVEIHRYGLDDAKFNPVSLVYTAVNIGDTIDFAVDNNIDGTNDWLYFRAKIAKRIRTNEEIKPIIDYQLDTAPTAPISRQTVTDTTGTFNHSSLFNFDLDDAWIAANVDNGLQFDGIDDYFETIRTHLLDGSSELTISLWVNPQEKFAFAPMFLSTGPQYNGLAFSNLAGTGIQFAVLNTRWDAEASTSPALNRWTHVVGVWKSGEFIKVYQDGVEIQPQNPVTPPTGTIDVDKWRGGRDRGSPAKYFKGALDDILVYTTALSAGQVRALYDNGKDAQNYDGSSIYTDIPSPVPNGATELTIGAWVYPRDAEGFDSILSSVGTHFNGLVYSNAAGFHPALRMQSTEIAATSPLPLNQWSYLTGVWEAGTTMKLYVNGIPAASLENNIPAAPMDIDFWRLGRDRSETGNRFFDGLIQDHLIIEEALTATQISEIVAKGRSNANGTHGTFFDSLDIGSPPSLGDFHSASGLYTLRASGNGLGGTNDSAHFVSREMAVDGEITTRVISSQGANSGGHNGVMFRASSAANATFVSVLRKDDQSVTMRWRTTAGAPSQDLQFAIGNDSLPKWVKLSRQGDLYTGSYSTDGVNWALMAEVTTSLGEAPKAGLVSASSSTTTSRSYFTDVDLSETVTTPNPDSDADQLPDFWERTHFNSLTSTSGQTGEDHDRDGFSDRNEFIAGTSPLDSSSLLRVHGITPSQSNLHHMTLTWATVSGKTYRVTRSSDLGETWNPVGTTIIGNGNIVIRELPMTENSQFYRVEIVTAP